MTSGGNQYDCQPYPEVGSIQEDEIREMIQGECTGKMDFQKMEKGCIQEEEILDTLYEVGGCEPKEGNKVLSEGEKCMQKEQNHYITPEEESIQGEVQKLILEEEYSEKGKGLGMIPKVGVYRQRKENLEEVVQERIIEEENGQNMLLKGDIQNENVQNILSRKRSNQKDIQERLYKEGYIQKLEVQEKNTDDKKFMQEELVQEIFMDEGTECKQEIHRGNYVKKFETKTKPSSSHKEVSEIASARNTVGSDVCCEEENQHGVFESSQQVVIYPKEFNNCREDPQAEEILIDQMAQDPEPVEDQEIEPLEYAEEICQDPEPANNQHQLSDFFTIQSEVNFDSENPENVSDNLDEFLNHLTEASGEKESYAHSNNVLKDIKSENSLENEEPPHPQSVHDPEIPFQYLEVFPDCCDAVVNNEYETTKEVYGEKLPSHLKNNINSNSSGKNKLKSKGFSSSNQDNIDNGNIESYKNHEYKQNLDTFESQTINREENYNNNNNNNNNNNDNYDKLYNIKQPQSSDLNNEIEGVSYTGRFPLDYYNNSSLEFAIEDNGDIALPSPLRKRLEEATDASGIDFFDYLPSATTGTSHQIIQNENIEKPGISHHYQNTSLIKDDSEIDLSNSISEQVDNKYKETFKHTLNPSQIQPNIAKNTASTEMPSYHNHPYQHSASQGHQDYNYEGCHPININPAITSSSSHNLSNQPKECMIPTLGYPPVTSLGLPPAIPIMCPSYIGQHMVPPPIAFPSIPLGHPGYINPEYIGKLPYYDPLQPSLPTWTPYTSFPRPRNCYQQKGNFRRFPDYNGGNSNAEKISELSYVPEHTCTRYYSTKYDKFLPCKVNNCNEMFYKNVMKDVTYADDYENIVVKMPNDVILVKNCNNKSNNDIGENLNNDCFNNRGNSIPDLSSSEEQVILEEKSCDMPIISQVPMLSKPSVISERQQQPCDVPIPEIKIDSLEVFPIDNASKKYGQENGRSNMKCGKIWTPQDRVPSLSVNKSASYIDHVMNSFNKKKDVDNDYNNNIKNSNNNNNNVDNCNNNVLSVDIPPLGNSKQNNTENAEIQSTRVIYEVLNEGKDEYCIDLIDNNCLNFNKNLNSNDSFNERSKSERVTNYVDLTISDSNPEDRDSQVVVDISEDDKNSPERMPVNAPHLKTYVPKFAKRLGAKVENAMKITTQRRNDFGTLIVPRFAKRHGAKMENDMKITMQRNEFVCQSSSEAFQYFGRKRGRPKGSKNKTSKEAREKAALAILEASQVPRLQKIPIPILPKESEERIKSTSNISAVNYSHKSKESLVNLAENKDICPNSTEYFYSEDFDDQFDYEPLGCIVPMEAENSEKNIVLSNMNYEDVNCWLDGQSQKLGTKGCKNTCYKILNDCDENINSSAKKDVNENYLMIMDSCSSVSKNNVSEPLDLERTIDPLGITSDVCSQQPQFANTEESSNNEILRLLDSESVRRVDQKDFCLASIDLMKQFRIIEVNQNLTKSEQKRNYVRRNKAALDENPYKKVYKERVRKNFSSDRGKVLNAEPKGYQDAFMKFLYKN